MTKEIGWFWRNCRELSFALHINIWPWAFQVGKDDDVYGGYRWVSIGPIAFTIHYDIGGLSEVEAYERAERYATPPATEAG